MLIEFHIIKNYPPTNLNRDETGAPKTCFFGGAQRGRISSQCLKNTWRRAESLSNKDLGIRTRYLPDLVAIELEKRGVSTDFIKAAKKKISGFGNKDGKEADDGRTTQIMFFSKQDIQAVTDAVLASIKDSVSLSEFEKIKAKQWQDILKIGKVRPVTLDIALFGRMITDDSFADVEASMQVAHAISTNEVNMESDFFTAVDDLNKQFSDDAGSAMMGDTDYNSCCYYLYASLDTAQLFKNLQSSPEALQTAKTILPILLEVMAYSNPSGKQNSFAGNVYPSLIFVECKEKNIPISYVNAFEIPIKGSYGKGLIKQSIEKLAAEINKFDATFNLPAEKRLWFSTEDAALPNKAEKVATLSDLLTICTGLLNNQGV